jgi:arylsulfatase A-like enzyme
LWNWLSHAFMSAAGVGYATGQFGKNHLGDRNEFLPTVHGFDEFFGNLYFLNAEEEPERPFDRWQPEKSCSTRLRVAPRSGAS